MTQSEMRQIGRLAMRLEDTWWVAYYAVPDSMEGAIELGRIQFRFVDDEPQRKAIFMSLMKDALGDIFEERGMPRPTWPNPPRQAPEHERKKR